METEGKFFGRIGELEVLQDAYDDGSAQMAIVYGRRRGKHGLQGVIVKE